MGLGKDLTDFKVWIRVDNIDFYDPLADMDCNRRLCCTVETLNWGIHYDDNRVPLMGLLGRAVEFFKANL